MQFAIHSLRGRRPATLFIAILLAACSGSGNADDRDAGAAVAASNAAETLTPIRISHGEEVVLKDYAVPGEITVFDFMSDYCPPCQRIAPWIDRKSVV